MSLQPKSVLVPIDFSAASLDAFEEGVKIAGSPASVHVVHVLADLASDADFMREALEPVERHRRAQTVLEGFVSRKHEGAQACIREGSAGEEIAAAADELGCDLIVIPSRGRSGLARLLLGSVVERVLRLASCPVLVLPASTDE